MIRLLAFILFVAPFVVGYIQLARAQRAVDAWRQPLPPRSTPEPRRVVPSEDR